MENNICKIDHSKIQEFLKSVAEDQGVDGRHRCAGCAYEQGYKNGRSGSGIRNLKVDDLPFSQGIKYSQRHKSPREAYELGYKKASEE